MTTSKTPQYEVPENTPEFYIDGVNIETQLYGTTMYLGSLRRDEPQLVKVIVKMSPQMAKVLGLILSKHIQGYEKDMGPISLPKQLLHNLGLEDML